MKTKYFFFLLSLFGLFSCEEEPFLQGDHFFVTNNGSSMPVYVRGNLESHAIILFLHGGPGGNSSQATFIPAFQDIEAKYAIAYWDQRASGLSQGNPDPSTFTLEHFTEDTHIVVRALKHQYPGKQLVILGHSWGGALGALYLSTNKHQSDIAGFICMNSGHNLEKGLPLSVEWVNQYAIEKIADNDSTNFWMEVTEWCSNIPDMTVPDNYFKYVEYLKETDAYRHNNQEVNMNNPSLNDILNSRLGLGIIFGGSFLSQNFNILGLNLSDDMANITIPTLVIWGKHDGVNTIEMGYDAFNSLGTSDDLKKMLILENSAHEGYLEQPEEFVAGVTDFINDI